MKSTLVAFLVVVCSGCASLGQNATAGRANPGATVNALWNDAGTDQQVGFWLYGENGTCPELRSSSQLPLVFGTKTAQANIGRILNVSDLRYCFYAPSRDKLRQLTRCESGNVELTYTAATKQYSGSYAFVMSDGSKREGKFDAAYCPAGPVTNPTPPPVKENKQ